ncbi:MAG: DUF6537 domain-containing protein, partial [Pseudomonadota bacterium]
LMAIKDEYEVARLHLDASFKDWIEEEFEGPIKLKYHLAPPMLNVSTDGRGRPKKREFRAWIRGIFRGLNRARRLRGTFFDPFRFHKDRRLDRDILQWFENLLVELPGVATDLGEEAVLSVLEAPMDIRGYGPVREAAAGKVRAHVEELLHPKVTRLAR